MKHFSLLALVLGVWTNSGLAFAQSAPSTNEAAPVGAKPPVVQAAPAAAAPGAAAPGAVAKLRLLEVPQGKGQPRLRIEREGAKLRATVCRGACAVNSAAEFELPTQLANLQPEASVRSSVLLLGEMRLGAHIQVAGGGQLWELVVAAPLTGDKPVVAFAGISGLTEGEAPDRTGTRLQLFQKAKGESDVVVGQLREDVQLCGREAVLSPQVLYAKDLTLHRVKLQRLSEAERTAAPELAAVPGHGTLTRPLLTTLVASSSVADPAGLTDGNTKTYWAEQRSGSGSGEFVVLRAPSIVEFTGFELNLRPSVPDQKELVAPSGFWIATDTKVYHVKVASDPWLDGETDFHVSLPEPIHASCVAIVLDTAFGGEKDAQVAIAEVLPMTSVDEAQVQQAVADLDGPEAKAGPAAELLEALGAAALTALTPRFVGLSAAGRMRALNVYDGSPCERSAAAYVAALTAPTAGALPVATDDSAERDHVIRRLGQCGKPASRAILEALPSISKAEVLELLTHTLAQIAPLDAVEAYVPMLARASRSKRRVLRAALNLAAKQPATHPRISAWLTDASLDSLAKIDLMRSLGDELGKFAESVGPAIQQLLAEGADFHTRYTLLAPLSRISTTHPGLLTLLVGLIASDEQPAVRSEAARLTPVLPATLNTLLKATSDPEPRVREAAIANLGSHQTDAARTVLQLRLRDDKWPLVRSASVRALGGLPADAETNAALAYVVERDTSPAVRRPAVLALGKLAARQQLRVLRATYELDVDAHVRAAAAAALGQLCDTKSLELMTKRAVTLATLSGSEDELVVAKASLGALGRLAPPDLRQRLKPFGGAKTPAPAREAVRAALTYHDVCGKQPGSP